MRREYDFSAAERGRFFRSDAKLSLPAAGEKPDWAGSDGRIAAFIVQEAKRTLNAYREQPRLITEHANDEYGTSRGGYAHRQLFELVQNSADALLDAPNGKSILIRLTGDFLYCADDGDPIDEPGVVGLMFARMSNKRNTGAIGRFGLGFKSVLGVTDAPEFYSRSGSFRFDRARAAERIAEIARADRYPALRLPEPIDPREAMRTDEDLRELMSWATNIVRLPLGTGTHGDLARQIQEFPPEFLLFVDHVRYLTLEDAEFSRDFILHDAQGELHLDTGEGIARWKRFNTTHPLSAEAANDRPLLNDRGDVPIWWAAPLDRLDRPGHFWAFFPTHTASLVAGILNAPWKTNEDRQNLLLGPYNEELIEVAAKMIASEVPTLSTRADPARHLDTLPRRQQSGDSEQSVLLRNRLLYHLHEREIVPDQRGTLRAISNIAYPPRALTEGPELEPLERWSAYPGRPTNWLHHKALTRNRLASIDRLFSLHSDGDSAGAPRATIAQWLNALVSSGSHLGIYSAVEGVASTNWLKTLVNEQKGDESVKASMAAIQTAAAIPIEARRNQRLGEIVLTADGAWRSPNPERLFLPDASLNGSLAVDPASCVHPYLASDRDTLCALERLGLKTPSPESMFRLVAKRAMDYHSGQDSDDTIDEEFWTSSRKLSVQVALEVIHGLNEVWHTRLRARTQAGIWQPLNSVLFAGAIVHSGRNEDDEAIVDDHFHAPDDDLLRALGVTEAPKGGRDLSFEKGYILYRASCRRRYSGQSNLPHSPSSSYLDFKSVKGVGPLGVLESLSDDARANYTHALLNVDATYLPWIMRHTGTNRAYPEMPCESFTVHVLREHGRIRTPGGLVPLAHELGPRPRNPAALHALLTHPKADEIRATFDLADPTPEFFGEDDPIPLADIWPGLTPHLRRHQRTFRLILCKRILVVDQPRNCISHSNNVYLADTTGDDELHKLQLVTDELSIDLSPEQLGKILRRKTPQEVEERRAAVRQHSTDAARLLAAVGERALRGRLPRSLLDVLETDGATLTGADIADAAIATWHTDALKQHKWALDRLDPPSKWAGSQRAVRFVQSLGFSAEWAGERHGKRDPFLEVEGPYSLPELHGYQRTIADRVRNVLRSQHVDGTERRGMISMPTGSGKTRVAVQAVVEAMRDDGFRGGVLWIADRDELCEQAVEAWRQVWSSIGTQAVRLRISRMWAGLEKPRPTSDQHVIVATIQTLNAKLSRQPREYEFLANFNLVVFDEAHRSIAPTFTSVMQEIGLTRFQRADEPFLLGLTATPYRGWDEVETARLARRYGSNRLDSGAFASDEPEDVIRQLQDMGVLAQADHETIEGETFPLDAVLEASFDEAQLKTILEKWRELPWLPQSVEDRIARSTERTKRIVEAYATHVDPEWPTLIFATSVEHARTVAALLNRRGIRSRAVSGETETATRRRVVEEFRRGEVRALVNYGVFREGFDAPKTRAIIVARPVYSPNLYFQMIGRGLRGPLNGGDDRCLILNVQDNIENFDRKLAFSELDWLWA